MKDVIADRRFSSALFALWCLRYDSRLLSTISVEEFQSIRVVYRSHLLLFMTVSLAMCVGSCVLLRGYTQESSSARGQLIDVRISLSVNSTPFRFFSLLLAHLILSS